jgi:hypothetical protein
MSNEHTPLPGPIQGRDEDQEQQFSILKAFMKTGHHFFGDVSALFQSVDDPRRPELILYPLPALLFTGVLMFLCRLGARRQIAHQLRQNGPSTAKFQALFGTDTCPHGDTLDVTFGRLDPDQVQAVVTAMVRTLIRKKVLDRYRLLGWYFVIAIDGTGRLTFPERHCPHCMTVTHNGKTTYYHPVLEEGLRTALKDVSGQVRVARGTGRSRA